MHIATVGQRDLQRRLTTIAIPWPRGVEMEGRQSIRRRIRKRQHARTWFFLLERRLDWPGFRRRVGGESHARPGIISLVTPVCCFILIDLSVTGPAAAARRRNVHWGVEAGACTRPRSARQQEQHLSRVVSKRVTRRHWHSLASLWRLLRWRIFAGKIRRSGRVHLEK
jgi:hypothetical protein